MKKAIFLLLIPLFVHSQKRIVFSGIVNDGNTTQVLPGANLYFSGLKGAITTDSVGKFYLTLPAGYYSIIVKNVGYRSETLNFNLTQNTQKDISLFPTVKELAEVEIKATKADKNIKDTQMGVVRIEMKNLKKIPVVFGEADIIKALTLQPGITTVGEGAGGFNVRGGRVDQNLVLLDGMPIYNTSHLLGFLSSINSDALSNVALYKSGVPAQYGGRLSSLLEMNTKNGNSEQISGIASVGILTSKVLLEGPLIKNKLTFVLAGRVAYPNFMIRQFPVPTNRSRAFFYDFNGKINYKINVKNNLTFSSYLSYDNFKFADDTLYFAKTKTMGLEYSRIINKKLTFNIHGVLANYDFGIVGNKPNYDFTLNSGINHNELRSFLLWVPSEKFKTEIGYNTIDYKVKGGDLKPNSANSNIISLKLANEFARESSPYISTDISITKNISLQAGVRYSMFHNLGPKTVFSYLEGTSRSTASIADSLVFSKNQKIKQYGGFEPRLSVRFAMSPTIAIKINYNRMRQYVHLISNTTAISPIDFWKVSDSNIPPQIADQLALGLFKNINDNTFEVSVEGYYKKISNLVEYKNGARLFFNPNIETELLAAKGKAYGIESSLQKNKGRLKGSFSYTYSRTFAKVNSDFPTEIINKGNWFPSTFDKPHNLAISTQYFIANGWTFSSNFVFASGRPITYPDRTYKLIGTTVIDYSARNLDRIPAYHRLDFALMKDTRKKTDQKKYMTYSFSLYNFYSRHNPYSIYFISTAYTIQSYQLSVFGSAILGINVTYNF